VIEARAPPSMEKRVTLALILCTVFVFGYSILVTNLRRGEEPIEPPPAVGEEDPAGPGNGEGAPADRADPAAEAPGDREGLEEPEAPGGEGERVVAEQEETHRLESDRLLLELTNRGAVPRAVKTKRLVREAGLDPDLEENWVSILARFEPDRPPLAMRIEENTPDLARLLWVPEEETMEGDERVRRYRVAPGNGLEIVKEFRLRDGTDHFRVVVRVYTLDESLANQNRTFQWTGPQGGVYEGDPTRAQDEALGVLPGSGGQPRTIGVGAIRKAGGVLPVTGNVEWAAVASKYFACVVRPLELPGTIEQVAFETVFSPDHYELLREQVPEDQARQRSRSKIGFTFQTFDALSAAGQAPLTYDFLCYAGLKDEGHLAAEPYEPFRSIVRVSGMGACGPDWIMVPIADLLLLILKGLYAVTGNYGVAIILLTLLVKLVLFPLTRHQQVTMAAYQAKMQKHKPELDKIREKYKNNRQKLNEETMKFFKQKGINPIPLGGCLPLLVTLPIFIGLFYLLRTAPELRQADFVLWIDDLSRPDQLIPDWPRIDLFCIHVHGLNLLPILMTVAWFLQQRAMPKSEDPQQRQTQQIMLFMPIVFGFVLYDYAAGLSLYWLTNSVIGLVEQRFIRRHLPVPAPAAAK